MKNVISKPLATVMLSFLSQTSSAEILDYYECHQISSYYHETLPGLMADVHQAYENYSGTAYSSYLEHYQYFSDRKEKLIDELEDGGASDWMLYRHHAAQYIQQASMASLSALSITSPIYGPFVSIVGMSQSLMAEDLEGIFLNSLGITGVNVIAGLTTAREMVTSAASMQEFESKHGDLRQFLLDRFEAVEYQLQRAESAMDAHERVTEVHLLQQTLSAYLVNYCAN
ncbi:hypothetical protein [Methylophaga frappieri]|nr:hypothetical protein [Methylophaga frappieri]